MGTRKSILSMPTVTTRVPACLIAASAAASSASLMIVPPWTLPALLASVMPIHRISCALESDGALGLSGCASIGRSYPRLGRARYACSALPDNRQGGCDAGSHRAHVDRHQSQDLK